MHEHFDHDVAIVGYGPVGQGLALALAQRGHRVAILERHAAVYPLPRAIHIDHEGMRFYQSVGLADEVEAIMEPARVYELYKADGSLLTRIPRTWRNPSAWATAYHFYQPELEEVVDTAIRRHPNITLLHRHEVEGLSDDDEGVTVRALHGDDDVQIRVRFAAGCDGANSVVREHLGTAQEDLGFQATWQAVDVTLDDGADPLAVPDTGQLCDPAGPTHMASLGGGHYRWEFMSTEVLPIDDASDHDRTWERLAPWVTREQGEIKRSALYTFRSLVALEWSRGRVAIAGDAAHVTPPFLGQGMVSGLRDAWTLAWVLDACLHHPEAAGDLLPRYTSMRRDHVRDYILEAIRYGEMICETDPEKARLRDEVMQQAPAEDTGFSPPSTDFALEGPLSGYLARQVDASVDGRAARLDDHLGTQFAVLVSGTDALPDPRAVDPRLDDALLRAWRVTPRSDPAAPAGATLVIDDEWFWEWFGPAAEPSFVIVRPDRYVYSSGPLGLLSDHLTHLATDLFGTTHQGSTS